MPRLPLPSARQLSAFSLPSFLGLSTRRLSTSSPSLTGSTATAPPPAGGFKFFVGSSFRGKPDEADPPSQAGRALKKRAKQQGFGPESPIGQWRDSYLKGKDYNAGEDWYFISAHEGSGRLALGVIDGVGGWSDSGIDPSWFSQSLGFHCWNAAQGDSLIEPGEIMESGFEGVTKDEAVVAGSSTACIATFEADTGRLRAANLGDSTFYIVRGGKVIHEQPSQTHFFNAPRQLSKLPKSSRNNAGALTDLPSDAALFETNLIEGDVVVLATDGFSDNVWPHELEQLVELVFEKRANEGERTLESEAATSQLLADACVGYARVCAFNEKKESPFEHEARKYGHRFHGGKVDDITALAVLVGKAP